MFYYDYEDGNEICNEDGEILSREDMLQEMKEHEWEHDLTEGSTDEEVAEEYLAFYEEEYDDCEDLLFPNGRDYDAEEGPFGG